MSNGKYDNFMRKKISNSEFTNTRIGNPSKNIYGGKYLIKEDDYETFLNNYYNHVFENHNKEYLTEKQLIENGPILLDIDLRYNYDIDTRQHTKEHIIDFLMEYMSQYSKIVESIDNTDIEVYVMEKNNVNRINESNKKLTKDGIHIIIGLSLDKKYQIYIRNEIIPEIKKIWSDLPLTNTFEDVLDKGIVEGSVNWQMYGSRKPNNKAYLLKYHFTFTNDSEWNFKENDIEKFKLKKNFYKLSARYNKHPSFNINKNIQEQLKNLKTGTKKITNRKITSLDEIKDETTLDNAIQNWLENISSIDYKLKETHEYTMILSEKYYGPGSYNNWIRVGWALASTDPKMLLTWIKFSSKSKEFDWNDIYDLVDKWKTFDFDNPDNLTHRSIMYWAKKDSLDEYIKIRNNTVDYFIEQSLTATEFDLANVLFNIYKDEYVCVSIKNNCWYEYKNNRWYEIDCGNSLRIKISTFMHDEYLKRIKSGTDKLTLIDHDDAEHDILRKRIAKLADICQLCKKTQWKNNIMREARELFFDKNFMDKLDSNPYLLCFNNFVIDFKNKIHRKGQPDDYISKSTNIDYCPLNKNKNKDVVNEINNFISELFPNEELCKYMWEHLASILVGTNENQTFNIYTGTGRNGKSKLVDLMSKCLGDYKGTVPITLITQKRNSIGSTSSEIVQLMGTRYAVMQEPSKGDKINEGIMKEITGGDPIQGRALFKDNVTFVPQFKLVVCTNTLFDIKSNDDGTWRRIRVCDFMSKFLENPYMDEEKFPKENYPYQYKIDKNIDQKFDIWAPVLMSMLVDISYKNQGNVSDCKIVMGSSDQYREGQDYLTEFIKDKIKKEIGGKVKITELQEEFKIWYNTNYGRSVPKAKELKEFMESKYGKYKNGWNNIAIIYDDDDDEINDDQ
tara:strand:+ start:1589 stop:4294 length:2706 start_codon:yes stop_codon:yes gene_type:complete